MKLAILIAALTLIVLVVIFFYKGKAIREIYSDSAPAAIGTYSQAIVAGDTVYLSGQVPLIPETMQLVEGDIHEQIRQIFKNLSAVCKAAGGSLHQIVKLNVYLTHLENFSAVNEVMEEFFVKPYPARAVIGVSALPKNAHVEIEATMALRP